MNSSGHSAVKRSRMLSPFHGYDRESGAAYIVYYILRHPSNEGRRVRKILEATVFQVVSRCFKRPMLATLGDHSYIWADSEMSASRRALYANPPDRAEMLAWRDALNPGDLFVDVGANIGLYTLLAIEAGAEVICVEPIPAAVRHLRRNLALNAYEAEIREVALGSEPGRMLMTTDLGVGNRLVLSASDASSAAREVEVSTLDDLVGDRYVHGLKLDVEGAELLVLQGGARALEQHRVGLIQLEWNHCSLDTVGQDRLPVAGLLQHLGYQLFRPETSGKLVPLSDFGFGPDVFAAASLPSS